MARLDLFRKRADIQSLPFPPSFLSFLHQGSSSSLILETSLPSVPPNWEKSASSRRNGRRGTSKVSRSETSFDSTSRFLHLTFVLPLPFPFPVRFFLVVGLSADSVEKHQAFVKDINEVSKSCLSYPLIGDADRRIASLYSMLDGLDDTNRDEVSSFLLLWPTFELGSNRGGWKGRAKEGRVAFESRADFLFLSSAFDLLFSFFFSTARTPNDRQDRLRSRHPPSHSLDAVVSSVDGEGVRRDPSSHRFPSGCRKVQSF